MPDEIHNVQFGHSSPRQPRNQGNAAAMETEMRQDANDPIAVYTAQELGPCGGSAARRATRKGEALRFSSRPHLFQHGPALGMQRDGSPLVALAVNEDLAPLPIDAGKRETSFRDSPALPDAKDKAQGHPSLVEGKMPFPFSQGAANESFLLCGDFRLFCGGRFGNFNVEQRIGQDESALHRLSEHAPQKPHLDAGGLDSAHVGQPTMLLTPDVIPHAHCIGHIRRFYGTIASKVAAHKAPRSQSRSFCARLSLLRVLRGEPIVHPRIKASFVRRGASHYRPALESSQIESLLPAKRVRSPLPTAFHFSGLTRAIPNPPVWATFSLIHAECTHTTLVTECNTRASEIGSIRGKCALMRGLKCLEIFAKETLIGPLSSEAGLHFVAM